MKAVKVRTTAWLWIDDRDVFVEVEADVVKPETRLGPAAYYIDPPDPGLCEITLVGDPETGHDYDFEELDKENRARVLDAVREGD